MDNFVEDVDLERFEKIKAEWAAIIEANPGNVSEAHYSNGLEYCEKTVNKQVTYSGSDGGCVCAVIKGGETFALVVITHAKKLSTSPNLKMLDMYVRPDLNLADRDPDYGVLAWVAGVAIVGCLELTYSKYLSEELKILTAFPLDSEFLTAVTAATFGRGDYAELYTVSSHANWLVVKKKPVPTVAVG